MNILCSVLRQKHSAPSIASPSLASPASSPSSPHLPPVPHTQDEPVSPASPQRIVHTLANLPIHASDFSPASAPPLQKKAITPSRAAASYSESDDTRDTEDTEQPGSQELSAYKGHSLAHIAVARPPLHSSPTQSSRSQVLTTQEAYQNSLQPANAPHQQQSKSNLPDRLKASAEGLSGFSLNDVHIYYNSPKPARVDAAAYTQGADIHLGPGQEEHLAHETWHVVQQKQRRVKTTASVNGMALNDEQGLEQEAEQLGKKILSGNTANAGSLTRMPPANPTIASLARQPLQRVIRIRANNSDNSVTQGALQNDQNPLTELGSYTMFRWYLAKVLQAGKTSQAVSDALVAMRDEPAPSVWTFDTGNQHLISALFGEIDTRIGLQQHIWNLNTYLQERAPYLKMSLADIVSSTTTKKKTIKSTKSEEDKPVDEGIGSSATTKKKLIKSTKSEETTPPEKSEEDKLIGEGVVSSVLAKKKLIKGAKSEETISSKKSGQDKPVDEGNVLGPFVQPTHERPIEYMVKGLTGNPIRQIYVSQAEKEALDEMYEAAQATMEEEDYLTWGQLKQPGATNDIPLLGVEIELKGMFINVSRHPDIAAAMAFAGHKPIAEKGNIEIHIDAAAGQGQALIEIVTKALKLEQLIAELQTIKKHIKSKTGLLEWLGTFRDSGQKSSSAQQETDASSSKEEGSSAQQETSTRSPKKRILDFVLDPTTKITYSKPQVHVQLTTTLTEREFAGHVAAHTKFKHVNANSNNTLAEVLKSSPVKTHSSKNSYALIKHAYEQLEEAGEHDIPEDTRVDKVPFKYTVNEEQHPAQLHTQANKISQLLTRNKERAFLVEYRGGDATTKHFIGEMKKYLEGSISDVSPVQTSIEDAFPHLKQKKKVTRQ